MCKSKLIPNDCEIQFEWTANWALMKNVTRASFSTGFTCNTICTSLWNGRIFVNYVIRV